MDTPSFSNDRVIQTLLSRALRLTPCSSRPEPRSPAPACALAPCSAPDVPPAPRSRAIITPAPAAALSSDPLPCTLRHTPGLCAPEPALFPLRA
ncbi:hypothetical protein SLEP1_g54113 [Rubroshorea leprosula]|uniref:Uncharacterized protein n=1 Tax=Rubroshorea leprosula TaxID=152421 RepID=A0AAV5MEA8_9ROSI|nr:hypothetical protein SLEP1_g54113 [Rubroshorea leprosula]